MYRSAINLNQITNIIAHSNKLLVHEFSFLNIHPMKLQVLLYSNMFNDEPLFNGRLRKFDQIFVRVRATLQAIRGSLLLVA
jgi:hypothetical protein